jgi:predicted nucleic-acid-binding Zn-ribbon protein
MGTIMQTQTHAATVKTDLTCWKCGEESLKEMAVIVDTTAFRSTKAEVSGIMQSSCSKCGTHSVNAAQALHNKILGRRNRKAIIKESNRKSG